jgi:hypothetical protein
MLASLDSGGEKKIGGPLFQTDDMHEYVLYDKLALQGVTYGRNFCMMK